MGIHGIKTLPNKRHYHLGEDAVYRKENHLTGYTSIRELVSRISK